MLKGFSILFAVDVEHGIPAPSRTSLHHDANAQAIHEGNKGDLETGEKDKHHGHLIVMEVESMNAKDSDAQRHKTENTS